MCSHGLRKWIACTTTMVSSWCYALGRDTIWSLMYLASGIHPASCSSNHEGHLSIPLLWVPSWHDHSSLMFILLQPSHIQAPHNMDVNCVWNLKKMLRSPPSRPFHAHSTTQNWLSSSPPIWLNRTFACTIPLCQDEAKIPFQFISNIYPMQTSRELSNFSNTWNGSVQ